VRVSLTCIRIRQFKAERLLSVSLGSCCLSVLPTLSLSLSLSLSFFFGYPGSLLQQEDLLQSTGSVVVARGPGFALVRMVRGGSRSARGGRRKGRGDGAFLPLEALA
jgi:hypothetical protein